jgi:LacI family transcriptional regulator
MPKARPAATPSNTPARANGRAITIMDVAREAGVSKSTVSLALQGSPLIRAETTLRVQQAAQRIGYVYNRRAAELRGQTSRTVAVLINDLMNPFFGEVLVGIERTLAQAGYIPLMAHTNEDVARQKQMLLSMREHNAAGIMLCPALGTPQTLPKLVQSWGIPLVILVRTLGSRSGYDYVGSDNEQGVYLATRHLLDAGHHRVAFLGGRRGVVLEQRLAGYRRALAQSGIAEKADAVVASDPTRAGGHEAMHALLCVPHAPAAAVCYNDIVAFGALSALGEHGLQAGRDFALVGFDNVQGTAHANPPLSTVDVRPSEIGEHAARTLLARIADPKRARQNTLTTPTLVIRQSG